jgi:hypothetical protein
MNRPFCRLKLPKPISFDPELRFRMILAPKFLELITLSILAFIHNKLFAALYLFAYCVLASRYSAPDPLIFSVYSVECRKCMIGVSLRAPMLKNY